MKLVREVVSREVIDDLWGAGYTILPRRRDVDPFFMPATMVPQGRSYQWMHLVHDQVWIQKGWAPVPASRHDGYFMPAGFVGDIEVNGLGLFEKPKFEVDAEHAENAAKAKKMVDDWAQKNSALFAGEVSVNGQRTEIGATKTIEDTTKIPRELTPYIAQIFEERDRISGDYAEESKADANIWSSDLLREIDTKFMAARSANPEIPSWPVLNAIVLPYAIENIRKRITEEATSGQAS
jgi:hypothetical protein